MCILLYTAICIYTCNLSIDYIIHITIDSAISKSIETKSIFSVKV